MADEHEGKQFQGKQLESFRPPGTGTIRVRGSDFNVVVHEDGQIVICFNDRTIRVGPKSDVIVEPNECPASPSPRAWWWHCPLCEFKIKEGTADAAERQADHVAEHERADLPSPRAGIRIRRRGAR